jgi:hypothetical protein
MRAHVNVLRRRQRAKATSKELKAVTLTQNIGVLRPVCALSLPRLSDIASLINYVAGGCFRCYTHPLPYRSHKHKS